ncbi:hypothetical protein E2C01_032043 [Portunus trituberculatus]|uniref:Uncharacterized protein n=1 Tax=Portunus trituberculatus TaxID=210409 RepID=A0A5B7F1R0_PORTR|nr:hypothetical protein [Portunus trituberculatus]
MADLVEVAAREPTWLPLLASARVTSSHRMLATKLSTVCRMSGVLVRPSLSAAPRTPLTLLTRSYRDAGRPFTRRSRLREAQSKVVETTQTTKGKIGLQTRTPHVSNMPGLQQLPSATSALLGQTLLLLTMSLKNL